MKNKQLFLLVAICIGFVTNNFAQHGNYRIQNSIGINGGITQFDIITDNFKTKSNTGFIGALSANVDLPHKWYNASYIIQFSENNVDISAFSPSTISTTEFVEYKMFTAQIGFLLHVKLIESYLTLDVGPMLQYNSELELKDDAKENYIISGYSNLRANEISDISKFNVNGAFGATAGFKNLKIRVQYMYGFLNMLNKLNDENLDVSGASDDKFTGNLSMIAFTAIFQF